MISENAFNIFVDPATQECLTIHEEVAEDRINTSKYLRSSSNSYSIIDGIPHLLYPPILSDADQKSQDFYDGRAQQYEDNLHLTFFTHNVSEVETRNSFIDKLKLNQSSRVLEIACGTGRDSELIAKRLHENGELHLQDISTDMIRLCYDKLYHNEIVRSYSVSNAIHLPYPSH